jgi:hypothetical protein
MAVHGDCGANFELLKNALVKQSKAANYTELKDAEVKQIKTAS